VPTALLVEPRIGGNGRLGGEVVQQPAVQENLCLALGWKDVPNQLVEVSKSLIAVLQTYCLYRRSQMPPRAPLQTFQSCLLSQH